MLPIKKFPNIPIGEYSILLANSKPGTLKKCDNSTNTIE